VLTISKHFNAMLLNMTITTEKRNIFESASLAGEAPREDGAWKVRIISEGQGSSGYYTRSLLESFHTVFDDVLSYKNHPTNDEGPESRDFTMIAGEIVGKTWVENDERGMAAVYGWYLPDPEYRGKLERYKKKLGVSIFAVGEGEVSESGVFKVTEFFDDPYTSVDVVIAAGARGKILESQKRFYANRVENASVTSAEVTKEKEGLSEMAEKDVLEALSNLAVTVDALVESVKNEAQAVVDADALSSAVEAGIAAGVEAYAKNIDAIAAAELLPTQEAELKKLASEGKDISQTLESAKAIAKEARESASGRNVGSVNVVESGQFSESGSSGYELKGFKSSLKVGK
jgi:hypothetical protein